MGTDHSPSVLLRMGKCLGKVDPRARGCRFGGERVRVSDGSDAHYVPQLQGSVLRGANEHRKMNRKGTSLRLRKLFRRHSRLVALRDNLPDTSWTPRCLH